MKRQRPSIDGFIPRRPTSQLGELHQNKQQEQPSLDSKQLHSGDAEYRSVGIHQSDRSLKRSEITESLREIDDTDSPKEKLSRRKRRKLAKRSGDKKSSKTKRIIKWASLVVLVIVLGIGAYVGIKALRASGNVFKGSIFDVVQNQPLKEDENGRSNFLIFGTAEDDEGGEHGGANLTDSIMVLSVNQTSKDAFMISLPRDLWVDYEETCTVGNQGKLNAVYFCASDDGTNEAEGAAALQRKAGAILGLDVQYYIHLNFTAVTEAVDAVGGVDVTIESDDPRGILDRNFDWKCGYRCYYVKYANGETVHLDGEHALALARARNASGGYGLPNGNFDREKNQQKIIKALREKAVSAGTLTNIGKVTGLIDALGNNLRTNIETKELRTLMDIATNIQDSAIRSLSLVEEDNMLVTTGNMGGQSIVRPIAGVYDYSAIQAYITKNASSDAVVREAAEIVVLNGTGQAGVAQTEADTLTEKGFTVSIVDNAPDGTYGSVELYKIGEGNTATAAKLKELYSVQSFKTGTPPVAVGGSTAFVVVIGSPRE